MVSQGRLWQPSGSAKTNLDFLVDNKFIHQVNSSEFIDSRAHGWHRNNTNESKSDNREYKQDDFEQVIN